MPSNPTTNPTPPATKRRGHRGRRVATGTLATLLAIATLLAGGWVLGGRLIAEQAALFLSTQVMQDNTRLRVGKVSGFPLLGLTVEDVRFEVQGPEGWFPFGAADRVEASYDLWGILHGRVKISGVRADGVRMEFREKPGGGLLLPQFRGGGGGGGDSQVQITGIDLSRSRLLFEAPWREIVADSLEGTLDITLADDVLTFATGGLDGILADSLGSIRLLSGALVVDDGVLLDRMEAIWDSTRLSVDGRPGSSQLSLDLQVRNLPLDRLGELLLEPGVKDGRVIDIAGRIERAHDGVAFSWSGDGDWDVWQLRATRGTGLIAARVLRLLDVEATVRGASAEPSSATTDSNERPWKP